MSSDPRVCARCGGAAEEGFLVDTDRGGVKQERWIAGPPEPSSWQLTKTKGKACFLVATYRCTACGHLSSFATEPAAPPSFFTP